MQMQKKARPNRACISASGALLLLLWERLCIPGLPYKKDRDSSEGGLQTSSHIGFQTVLHRDGIG